MPPRRQHTWAKLQAGEQGRLDGAGASEGQAWWLSGLRSAPTSRASMPEVGRPFLQPSGSPCPNLSVQPGSSPATRSKGRRNGFCHPRLGSKSSLVPTVEQKAAHHWTGSPHPLAPVPAPLHLHLCLPSWSAFPHPTPSPEPLPSGATRETTPALTRSC